MLKDVNLYKVGHHGSRNFTPKTLWKRFARKQKEGAADRLLTINSTMKGKHGHSKNNTEVPRSSLVKELTNLSDYRTTEEAARKNDLFIEVPISL